MTPETKIPVYRREIAPEISFTTFSSEGTTLIGWIVDSFEPSVNAGTHGICCDLDVFYQADNRVLSPEAAIAYARAGMKGLRFEPDKPEAGYWTFLNNCVIRVPDEACSFQVTNCTWDQGEAKRPYSLGERGELVVAERHDPPVDSEGPKDKDGRPIRFVMKPPTKVRFNSPELRDQLLGDPDPETWRDRKPLF